MWKKELVSFVALGREKRKYPICFDLAMGDMCYFSAESALFAREEDRTAGQTMGLWVNYICILCCLFRKLFFLIKIRDKWSNI